MINFQILKKLSYYDKILFIIMLTENDQWQK